MEPITNVATADVIRHFRWFHNLQSARPVKKVFLPWPDGLMERSGVIAYHSRRLCYHIPDDDRDKVVILDLETGQKSIWSNGGGEPLGCFRLSDRYLIIVSADG